MWGGAWTVDGRERPWEGGESGLALAMMFQTS